MQLYKENNLLNLNLHRCVSSTITVLLKNKSACDLTQTITREYVYFRSRDKHGGRTIPSAVAVNSELLPIEVLHCSNREFRAIFAAVTFTLARRPSFAN